MRVDGSVCHLMGTGCQLVFVLFVLLVLLSVGCKFTEPEPSEEIYLTAVAPGIENQGGQPTVPRTSSVPRKLLDMIQATAPTTLGFSVAAGGHRLLFNPPADMIYVMPGGGLRTYIDGACHIGVSAVRFPCQSADDSLVRAEALAARVLYGQGLGKLARRHRGNTIVFRDGDGPAVEVVVTDRGVSTIRHNGNAIFAEILNGGEPQALAMDSWRRLLAVPASGSASRVIVSPLRTVCVEHTGGLSSIGPSVRAATDKAKANKLTPIDAVGVRFRVASGKESVCIGVDRSGPGAVLEVSRPVWRTWHRGSYDGLVGQQKLGADLARSAGQTLSNDCTTTLYHDPSTTPAQDLVSHIDCKLIPDAD